PPDPPVAVPGVPSGSIAEIVAGNSLSYDEGVQCLRLAGTPLASAVYCWGDDAGGALGADAPDLFRAWADVNVTGATSLTTAQSSTGAVLSDGSAVYWGTSYTFGGNPAPTPQTITNLGMANKAIHDNDSERAAYVVQTTGAPTLIEEGAAMPTSRLLASG